MKAGEGIPPPSTLERASWCAFDFANSSFTTIIITVVYPHLFVALASTGQRGEIGWAWALAVSQTIVVLLSPVVGVLADQAGRKKAFLAASWICCVIGCATLSFTTGGPISLAWAMVVVANIAFSFGENLIAAFLPELAPREQLGRLSGIGWAVGYFGGLASLAVALVLVKENAVGWVPAATAGFFLVAGLPTFLFLRERATPKHVTARLAVAEAFGETRRTFSQRKSFPDLFRLLLVLFLEQAGVAIVVAFSAVYAKEMFKLEDDQVILLFIGLQVAAAGGAALFGFIQDKVGGKRALLGTVLTWLLAVGTTLLAANIPTFCVGAAIAGIAMGSSQASGRAMVGAFTPPSRQGEWFGLWGLAMKAAAVVGPVAYALVRGWGSMKAALASTVVFFLLSLLPLGAIDERRGIRAAGGGT
jgi:UMF1 family MFS transporter